MTDNAPPEPSPRATLAAFLILALAVVGGLVLVFATRPEPVRITILPPAPTATPAPSATPGPITVYLTGALAGGDTVLALSPGSRVQDALDAAGGVTANADLARVNLAAFLRDGDQIHVPSLGEPDTALATPSGGERIYVNSASAEDLQALPGVGPALAQTIVDYRAEHGPFADLQALDDVPGIGPRLLEQIADRVAFD